MTYVPPCKNGDFQSIFPSSISAVTPSEKSLIMTYRKSTKSLPMSLRGTAYVAPKPPSGAQKRKMAVLHTKFENTSAITVKRCTSAPVLGPKPWCPSLFQPWLRPWAYGLSDSCYVKRCRNATDCEAEVARMYPDSELTSAFNTVYSHSSGLPLNIRTTLYIYLFIYSVYQSTA